MAISKEDQAAFEDYLEYKKFKAQMDNNADLVQDLPINSSSAPNVPNFQRTIRAGGMNEGFYRGGDYKGPLNSQFFKDPVPRPGAVAPNNAMMKFPSEVPPNRPTPGRNEARVPNDIRNGKTPVRPPSRSPGTGNFPNRLPAPGNAKTALPPNAKTALPPNGNAKAMSAPGTYNNPKAISIPRYSTNARFNVPSRVSGGASTGGAMGGLPGLVIGAGVGALAEIGQMGIDEHMRDYDERVAMQSDANTMGRELEFAAQDGYKPQFLQEQLESPKTNALLNLGRVLAEYEFARREMDTQNAEAERRRREEEAGADAWFAEQERYRREGNGPGPGYNLNDGYFEFSTPDEYIKEFNRVKGGEPAAVPVRGNSRQRVPMR